MSYQEVYDLLLDVAASSQAQVEEVIIGLTWTLCRAEDSIGLAMSPGGANRRLPWSGTLSGRPVSELARWIRSWDPYESVVGMAGINAVINNPNGAHRNASPLVHYGPGNLAVFEHFLPPIQGKRIVVVGRYPGLERFEQSHDLTVLELQPGPSDLPATAAEFVLREAEWVFLSATTLPNKTFPRLVELARDANVVLMGPTVPWLPELADFGIDFLAGVRIEDPAAVRQTVAEGGGIRLFENGARYHVMDLGAKVMEATKQSIAEVVTRRERLKREMEAWYQGPWRGSYPRAFELEAIDRELSALDSRFKSLWDARFGGAAPSESAGAVPKAFSQGC